MRKAIGAIALAALIAAAPPAKFVKCSIAADGLVSVFIDGEALRVDLPRTFVFNRDGLMTLNASGYTAQTPRYVIASVRGVGRPGTVPIEAITASLRTSDGKPVDAAALRGEVTVIEFVAPTCKMCPRLDRDLQRIGGITVLQVDADTRGREAEIADALKKRLAQH